METGAIYRGDCFDILQDYNFNDSVDLIYLDPPFYTSQNYEIIFGDGYERRSFEDRWKGGINHYLKWMRKRMEQCYFALKSTGSIYLHCDPHAGHYLKQIMDEVFNDNNFKNEIIWKRTSAHSSAKRYGPVHDTIFFYTKSNDYLWNKQYTEYDEEYVENFYRYIEPKTGRKYRLSDLMASGIRHGSSGKIWHDIDPNERGNHWKYTIENLEKLDKEGRIYWPKKAKGVPQYKRYLDEMKGVPLQDVWVDIPPIASHSKEREGYPTQKPELLLKRIIKASSNPNDIILDPFCGCGTTLVVAHKLKRKWVGIDVSPSACKLMERRLRKIGASSQLINMPTTPKELKLLPHFEFENWVASVFHGRVTKKTGDKGIDVWAEGKALPIQVKQSERVGRNVVDNFETAIKRAKRNRGMIVAFSFTKGAFEEVARADNEDELKIKLTTVKEILKNEKKIEFGNNSLEQFID